MKTRNGFVSNSSTSSFVLLNVQNRETRACLIEATGLYDLGDAEDWYEEIYKLGWEDVDHGLYKHKSGITAALDEDGECWAIGLELVELLRQNYKLSECKVILKNKADHLGINILLDDMDLLVETSSSG